jgi:hypothetical protein
MVPMPSSPERLEPQVFTVPSLSSAIMCSAEPAICVTPVRPGTVIGFSFRWRVPSPIWPEEFSPHARTVPSSISTARPLTSSFGAVTNTPTAVSAGAKLA